MPRRRELTPEQVAELPPLARKVRRLLERNPMTVREVSALVHERSGGRLGLSPGYLSKIAAGGATKISSEIQEALAIAFGVRVAYFTDDPAVEAEVEAGWAKLDEMRMLPNAGVAQEIASLRWRRAALDDQIAGLSAAQRDEVENMVEAFLAEQQRTQARRG